MALKTMLAYQRATGRMVTINIKDFDPEFYAEQAPVRGSATPPKVHAPEPKAAPAPEPKPEPKAPEPFAPVEPAVPSAPAGEPIPPRRRR